MIKQLIVILFTFIFMSGCFRGTASDKPPIHVNPNMDIQEKYIAQSKNYFFADGSSMRTPIEGVLARGQLKENTAFYFGKDENGDFVIKAPIKFNEQVLIRGKERFGIFCMPCHSEVGDGQGIIVKKGFLPAPTFHQDTLRTVPDGYIFNVITNGIRMMPSYKHQITVEDRWAIIGYFRELQCLQPVSQSDIPQ